MKKKQFVYVQNASMNFFLIVTKDEQILHIRCNRSFFSRTRIGVFKFENIFMLKIN